MKDFLRSNSPRHNRKLLSCLTKKQLIHLGVHVAKSVEDNRVKLVAEAVEQGADVNPDILNGDTVVCSLLRAVNSTHHPQCAHNIAFLIENALFNSQKWQWVNDLYHAILGKPHFPNHWKTRDTVSIAKDMLTSRNLKDMPILADALEDAGCTDHEVLYHLRNDEGLWTSVDWVLVNLGDQ